jgi:hypothetical protein
MQSGEDVIADIREVRASEDHTLPLAYQFNQPYSVVIEQPADKMFDFQGEETVPDEMDLADVQIKLFPWSPLTVGSNIVSVVSVVSLGDPHENVVESYKAILKSHKPAGMSVYFDEQDATARDL